MDQDTWFSAFLTSSPTWTYEDGILTLTNGTDTVVFDPRPAVPRRWSHRLEAGRTDLQDVLRQHRVGRRPEPDRLGPVHGRQVAFNTSCNIGGGSPRSATPPSPSARCATHADLLRRPERRRTEQVMNTVLQGVTPYTLTTTRPATLLMIMSTDGTTGLRFVADPTVGADAFADAATAASPTADRRRG